MGRRDESVRNLVINPIPQPHDELNPAGPWSLKNWSSHLTYSHQGHGEVTEKVRHEDEERKRSASQNTTGSKELPLPTLLLQREAQDPLSGARTCGALNKQSASSQEGI